MVKIIEQSFEILTDLEGLRILKQIEKAARTCYKSEDEITEDGSSAKKLITILVKRGHTAMIEHGGLISVKIICNRGLTHELVRHRLASYAQESSRYVKYKGGIVVILPLSFKESYEVYKHGYETTETDYGFLTWLESMKQSERAYLRLIELGYKPQIARGVLPIDVKTEIIVSANPTEWRHIFKMRTANDAHPQIRAIMRDVLDIFKEKIPIVFDDITY